MRLKDKVALLVGVGEKSSRATAVLFAQEGGKLAIVARRKETLAETAGLIEEAGGEVLVISGDGTIEEDVRRMVAQTVERYGHLDILYNNVSGAFRFDGRLHEMPAQTWDEVRTAILDAAFLLSRAALPELLRRGKGTILHVTASHNVQVLANPAYAAAKAGVEQLARHTAREYREDGIRVNCIAPGFMRLRSWAETAVRPDPQFLFRVDPHSARQGLPEDIAYAAAYLASDEANWVTGQVLRLEGGDDVLQTRPIPPARP